jgi:hypothetical protein
MALGAFKKDTAELVLQVVRYLVASGFVIDRPGRKQQFIPPDAPIYVRNDSGEVIPPFACMQTDGAVDVGGQNYIKVIKPVDDTGAAGKYLFNSVAPIEASGELAYGVGYSGPLVRMLTDGSAVNCGDAWQPDVGAWAVTPGGSIFTACGEDDIDTNIMRAFINAPAITPTIVEYVIDTLSEKSSGPYTGLMAASATVKGCICGQGATLIDTTIEVIDHSGCIFDIVDMTGYTGWAATNMEYLSLDSGASPGDLSPCHYAAINRCCAPDSGTYA